MLSPMSVDPFKYQLVIDHIRSLISNGLPRGSRLPTERVLAEQLEISRVSVRRALDALVDSGEVRRVQGSGTFVEGPSVEKGGVIRSFTQEMTSRGSVPGARVLSITTRAADADLSWQLKISPGEPVLEVRRLRTADSIPMCIETDVIPEKLAPGLADLDLAGSLYEVLESAYGIELSSVRQTFNATTLDAETAALLAVAPHSAALEVHHVAYAPDGTAIHSSSALYRGDRYRVTIDLPSVARI